MKTHSLFPRLLLAWVLLAVLFSGCAPAQPAHPSAPPALAPAARAAPAAQGAAQRAPTDLEDPALAIEPIDVAALEFRVLEGETQPAAPALPPPLGAVTFTPAPASAVERDLSPADGATELQAVDAAGLTWTLAVPAGALQEPVTLRLVPLAQVDGSALPATAGTVTGGVSLEPDGLTFLQPLQLSVSGEALKGVTFILAGSAYGGGVDYALQDPSAPQPTAGLLHFSTYFASSVPEPGIVEAYRDAMQKYKALAVEAKKMIKSPIEAPLPPAIPLECTDAKDSEEQRKAIEKFVTSALEPETKLLEQMIIQWRRVVMTAGYEVEPTTDLMMGLVLRLNRKAQMLIKQYYGDETRLLPVSAFALNAARQLTLMSGDPEIIQSIITDVANWNQKLIGPLLKEIKKNHNYKRIPAAMMVARNSALLGNADLTRSFLEDLREVLRFEATFTLTITDPVIHLSQTTEAVVPMQFEPAYGWVYKCYAQGQGKGVEAVMETDYGSYEITLFDYPVRVSVEEFDPCAGTVKMSIDRFGSEKDKILALMPDHEPVENAWTLAFDAGESVFAEFKTEVGMYTFTVPVNNGQVEAVNTIIEPPPHDNFQDTLKIKLVHK